MKKIVLFFWILSCILSIGPLYKYSTIFYQEFAIYVDDLSHFIYVVDVFSKDVEESQDAIHIACFFQDDLS